MATDECPKYPVVWYAGDELPTISGVFKDVDITGWTIELHLERPTTVLVKAASIVDAAQGQFLISWASTDLVAGKNQLAVLRATNASAEPQTPVRFLIDVEALPA